MSSRLGGMHTSSLRRPTGQLFEINDCVEVFGLESETGKALNGQTGVVFGYKEETKRFDVRFGGEKEVALKLANLRKPQLIPGDLVEVSGLESASGQTLNGQKGHVTKYIETTGCFQVSFEPDRSFNLKAENVSRPALAAGDSVEVCGLESDGGKQLNGQKAVVMRYVAETERYQVNFIEQEKVVSLKLENITRPPLGPGDVVLVAGLESEAGRLLNEQRGIITSHCQESNRFEVRFKMVTLSPDNLSKAERPLNPGDCVVATDLPPESGGKMLNGQKGLITKYLKETNMYHVRFGPSKAMTLKADHLRKFGPSPGDNVEVSGLESESGRQLNGQRGVVVSYVEETGRFQVKFGADKVVNLKSENLGAFKAM